MLPSRGLFVGQHSNIDMPDSAPPAYGQNLEDVNCFSEADIRRGFVRKVYVTLMVQLLITIGIICAFLYCHTILKCFLFVISSQRATTFVLIMVLSCCGDIRRKVPLNFFFLGLFTIAEGLLLGSVTVFYDAQAVMWAVGATALVSFALSVFAMQSKWDFTVATGSMWVICWTLISFGLLCAILRSQYLNIVYASLGTLVFSIYLVMDTQLMLGKKHKYSISPEEYIFAALNLYIDIVVIFLMILQLIGLSR
uniref:Zgc:110410 n=1 Tax=Electrophorus electricus TaxID=8005 RepID=A0A4W4G7B4_ELEEL